MEEMKMKKCSKCGEEKPATAEYFHKDKNRKDGFNLYCKECIHEISKKQWMENRALKFNEDDLIKYKTYRNLKDLYKENYKVCSQCLGVKPLNEDYFYKDKNKKDGYVAKCKECIEDNRINQIVSNLSEFEKNEYLEKQKKYKTLRYLKLKCKDGFKICANCLEEKPYESFNKDKSINDCLTSYCKECQNKFNEELKYSEDGMYSVYIHTNLINNKSYVGMTYYKPEYRWRENGEGYCKNEKFYNDIKLFGWNNFVHKIIKSGLTKEEAEGLETKMIKIFESNNPDFGYNISLGIGTKGLSGSKSKTSIKVKCDNMIFGSVKKCSEFYKIPYYTMAQWLNGNRPMSQYFINLGLQYLDKETNLISYKGTKKKVTCNGIIYNSITQCSEELSIPYSNLQAWLSGRNPMPQEFKDMGLDYYIEN